MLQDIIGPSPFEVDCTLDVDWEDDDWEEEASQSYAGLSRRDEKRPASRGGAFHSLGGIELLSQLLGQVWMILQYPAHQLCVLAPALVPVNQIHHFQLQRFSAQIVIVQTY